MTSNLQTVTAEEIFGIRNSNEFRELALRIFRLQAAGCPPYREYLGHLGCDPGKVSSLQEIPFLPVSLFKTRQIITGERAVEKIFRSSSTTGMIPSQHQVTDLSVYDRSLSLGFRLRYGEPSDYAILALLPSYIERGDSSLVYMAGKLMEESGREENGFYLYNHSDLYNKLAGLRIRNVRTILIGVSFALVDFASEHKITFPELIVIETGGMKNVKRELSRSEIHRIISEGFGVRNVHSEYGMTELISQAYSCSDGIFNTPPWMKILIRDLNNPFKFLPEGKRGGINVIDLANINSCSFIETGDLGVKTAGDSFEVYGRIKFSELRGCNLLLE